MMLESRHSAPLVGDVVAWGAAFAVSLLFRPDLVRASEQWLAAAVYILAAISLQFVAWSVLSFHFGRSRAAHLRGEMWCVGLVVLAIAVSLGFAAWWMLPNLPQGMSVAVPALALILMAGTRWVSRSLRPAPPVGERAVVYGAGFAGWRLAALLDEADEPSYAITSFVDDDPEKLFERVGKYRVLGCGEDLARVAELTDARVVLLPLGDATHEMSSTLSDQCGSVGLRMVVWPPSEKQSVVERR